MIKLCPVCNTSNIEMAKFCAECRYPFEQEKLKDNNSTLSILREGENLNGRYIIKELIKSGGMGAVYKAEDIKNKKTYAIKELCPSSFDVKKERDYFIRKLRDEAMLLSILEHPNIISVHDYFFENECYYLVMEYIEGQDLYTLVAENGDPGLPQEQAVNIIIEICNILEYLHNQNPPVIYRDLKPSNIMIRKSDNRVFLIDFGIACIYNNSGSPRTQIGTNGYMAPEQYIGKPVIASDIYSLGATLYHIITGKRPLPFLYNPMSSICPEVLPELETIVKKSLSLKTERRFESIKEIKKILEKLRRKNYSTNRLKADDYWLLHLSIVEDKDFKLTAIITLGELASLKALPELGKLLLNDKDPEIRLAAARALRKINSPKSIEFFSKAIWDEDPEISIVAMKSLNDLERTENIDMNNIILANLLETDNELYYSDSILDIKLEPLERSF